VPPTTTTTTVPSGPSCGATMLKADGSPWQCTFADEFDGTALDRSKWVVQETATSGFTSGYDCVVDDPDNVSVAGGTLRLTARKEAAPQVCAGWFATPYTSGSISTMGKFSQTYGRFEFRAKLPDTKVQGVQSAMWLWPDNATKYGSWPASGEIDVGEFYSKYPDRVIPYIHYNQATPDPTVTNNYCMIDDVTAFHTYVAEWTPTTISIIYDGTVCTTHVWNPAGLVKPAPFDHPFMLALTQTLGIHTNAFDPFTTPLPATMEVDYVHVWK
jgi:beta-glucanase (GH16 family)